MPVIQLKTNCPLAPEEKKLLMSDIAAIVAEKLNKPLGNLMVSMNSEDILMAGSMETAVYVDIRYISRDLEVHNKDEICLEVLNVIQKHITVRPERVMIFIGAVSDKNAWKWAAR